MTSSDNNSVGQNKESHPNLGITHTGSESVLKDLKQQSGVHMSTETGLESFLLFRLDINVSPTVLSENIFTSVRMMRSLTVGSLCVPAGGSSGCSAAGDRPVGGRPASRSAAAHQRGRTADLQPAEWAQPGSDTWHTDTLLCFILLLLSDSPLPPSLPLSALRCVAVEPAGGGSQSGRRACFCPAPARTDVPERGRGRRRHAGEEEELHLLSDCPHHEAGEGDAHRQPGVQGQRSQRAVTVHTFLPQDKFYIFRDSKNHQHVVLTSRWSPGSGLVSETGSVTLSGRRALQLQHQRRALLHHARHQQRLRQAQRGEPAHCGVPAGGPVHAAERPGPVLLQPDRDQEGSHGQHGRHQVWAWPLTLHTGSAVSII